MTTASMVYQNTPFPESVLLKINQDKIRHNSFQYLLRGGWLHKKVTLFFIQEWRDWQLWLPCIQSITQSNGSSCVTVRTWVGGSSEGPGGPLHKVEALWLMSKGTTQLSVFHCLEQILLSQCSLPPASWDCVWTLAPDIIRVICNHRLIGLAGCSQVPGFVYLCTFYNSPMLPTHRRHLLNTWGIMMASCNLKSKPNTSHRCTHVEKGGQMRELSFSSCHPAFQVNK